MEAIQQGKNYRITKSEFKVVVENQQDDLDDVIALDNYLVALIFDTGKIKIVDVLSKTVKGEVKVDILNPIKSINDDDIFFPIKNAFAYDSQTIGFINTTKRCLEFLNLNTFQTNTVNIFAQLPTDLALPQNDINDEKLQSLYRDGTNIVMLPQSGYIVSLECKMAFNSNSTENIVTVFHKNQEGKFFKQVIFQQVNNKMLYLTACNKTDTVAVFGQSFQDQTISFFLWKITEDAKPEYQLKKQINGVLLEIKQFGDNKLSLWGNYNWGNYPWCKIIDLKEYDKEEETKELDLFQNQGDQEFRAWCFQDIHMIDYQQQKIIWERKGEEGTFLDVFNPQINQVTFSERIQDEEEDEASSDLYKTCSSNGKYLLGYNKDVEPVSENSNIREIPLVMNQIVSVGSSLYHLMKHSGIKDKFGSEFVRNCIIMLTKQQQQQN